MTYICSIRSTGCTRKCTKQTELDDTLYPFMVFNQVDKNSCVRIHYIGYGQEFDEWREPAGLVELSTPCTYNETYDLQQELAWEIKSTLTSSRKSNPSVSITMPLDKILMKD